MKPLVIYHANCTDGFGAAFAAWLKLGYGAEYLPMEYGKNFLTEYAGSTINREIYILDFSLPKAVMDWLFGHAKRVVWLDHHKTAFEMWLGDVPKKGWLCQRLNCTEDNPSGNVHIELNNNKSGALLAWEYFHHPGTKVPKLIQHIDDRDRWQFKLDGSKELHAALASYKPWTFEQWEAHFLVGDVRLGELKGEGAAILRAHSQQVQSALKQATQCWIKALGPIDLPGSFIDGILPGWQGIAANSPAFLASDLGHELANQSGTFGLVWSMAGDGQIHCSLRSNGDYDVSAIAKCFGGGGHRNAAGFSTNVETLLGWLK